MDVPRPPARVVEACRRIVRLASVLVPAWQRAEWRQEWDAEITHRADRMATLPRRSHAGRALVGRTLGAFSHAAALRRRHWSLAMLVQDVRYACRALVRTPGFTLAAVLTLALALGGNAVIFTVVDSVLLRPAPVQELDRLALIWETDRTSGTTREPASIPDFLDYTARSRQFQQIAAFVGSEVNLAPPDGDPVRLIRLEVSDGFIGLLGIPPLLGRSFAAAEHAPGGPQVCLISESMWARLFARSPAALGQTLRLDDVSFVIVGVVPTSADFGVLQILSTSAYGRGFADRGAASHVDIWTPLQPDPQRFPRSTHPLLMIGRLAAGVQVVAAQEETAAISADLERTYRENAGRGVFVEPLADVVFGSVRPALVLLVWAVALVLLVACVNVANLLLARGASRAPEVALRIALGAGRARLARQFVTENLVLVGLGAVVGLGLAVVGLRGVTAIAPADVPRLDTVGIDLRVLALTAAVSALIALTFGLVPLVQARQLAPQAALRGEGGRGGSPGRSRRPLRAALVVAEVSMAVMLLVGAGLLIRSFVRLQQVDPGFRASGVLKAEYQLPPGRYPANFAVFPNFREMHAFSTAVVARVSSLPGVEAVAVAGNHPLDPGFTNSFGIVGRQPEPGGWPEISVRRVSEGYFRTVSLPLLDGRGFREADGTFDPPVALINEAAIKRLFPHGSPLGAQIRLWGAARTIIGVVGDEHIQGVTRGVPMALYLPLAQAPGANGAGVLLVRTAGDPSALASAVRGAIREVDPGLAVFGVEPLSSTLWRSVSRQRFTMLVLGLFAAVALALAAIGVFGVLSYQVTRRQREIGLRAALGAAPSQLIGLVLKEGLLLTAVGLLSGLAGSVALSRLLAALLFGVTPWDPVTLAGVTIVLGMVALGAAVIPARRAMRVDPATALRLE